MTTENGNMRDDDRAGEAGRERLLELLADRAVFGLDDTEEGELAGLLRAHPDTDPESLDRIAAAVAVATGAAVTLPGGLRSRLADGLERHPTASPTAGSGRRLAAATIALLAVAACLLVLLGPGGAGPWPRPEPLQPAVSTVVATAVAQRDEFLATVPDAVQLDCEAVADGTAAPAAGDVVWSRSRQRGFLRIGGLATNDPAASRYQVWIIDGDRGTPVSGGRFDVTSGDQVIVPILPQGFVQGPRMFAVTLEPPAGRDGDFDREKVVARAE